jgi:two-component system response regulator HydG
MRDVNQVVPFLSHRCSQERLLAAAPLLAGSSPAATQLRAQIVRIAPYLRIASLSGAAGSGEEQVARALHEGGPHHDLPFHILMAAEAEARFATNKVQPVSEGLLYLSEAEHLSPAAQAGLLRLLRERSRRPLRVVAFTGRGLRPLLSAGVFDPELARLLGDLTVALPPLRERKADLTLLLQTLIKERSRGLATPPPYLSDNFLQAVTTYNWPGNLEQMRAVVAWLLESRTGTLQALDLSAALDATSRAMAQAEQQVRLVPLDHVVHEHIRSVLMACNGNKLRAAEVLGISRSTLYRMLDTVTSFNPMQLAG